MRVLNCFITLILIFSPVFVSAEYDLGQGLRPIEQIERSEWSGESDFHARLIVKIGENVDGDGTMEVTLDDSTIWQVQTEAYDALAEHQDRIRSWGKGTFVRVVGGTFSYEGGQFKFYALDKPKGEESVEVKFKEAQPNSLATRYIAEISEDGRFIVLSDGSQWNMSGWRIMYTRTWQIGDPIAVTYRGGWDLEPAYLLNLNKYKSYFQRYQWVAANPSPVDLKDFDPPTHEPDPYGRVIVDISGDGGTITLDDGTVWTVRSVKGPFVEEFGKGEHWAALNIGEIITENTGDYVKEWGVGTTVRLSGKERTSSMFGAELIELVALDKTWETWKIGVTLDHVEATATTLRLSSVTQKGQIIGLNDGSVWKALGYHSNWFSWQPGEIVVYSFNSPVDPVPGLLLHLERSLDEYRPFQWENITTVKE